MCVEMEKKLIFIGKSAFTFQWFRVVKMKFGYMAKLHADK